MARKSILPPPPSGGRPTRAKIADVRRKFESVPEGPDRTRAFVLGKVDMIKAAPNMSDSEKRKAVDGLMPRRRS